MGADKQRGKADFEEGGMPHEGQKLRYAKLKGTVGAELAWEFNHMTFGNEIMSNLRYGPYKAPSVCSHFLMA